MMSKTKMLMTPAIVSQILAAALFCSCSDKAGTMDDPVPEVATVVLSDDAKRYHFK